METLFQGLPLADIASDMARNIVSLRVSENLYDDLSDDPDEQDVALNHELSTKPPEYTAQQPIINRPFEESAWWTAIGFPFKNWQQSRFSPGNYGVWYGATTIEATVHETVHHWRNRLLADAEGYLRPGVVMERKVYWVRCNAALLDLRPALHRFPDLLHPSDYTFTHQVGSRLHREGHPGLMSRSARCDDDVCAIFNPQVLANPRTACFLTYTTTENGIEVERDRKRGEVWMRLHSMTGD